MKSHEFLTEYNVHTGIIDILKRKGYQYIGRGQDQIAFLEPDTGMVLKIFGSSTKRGQTGFTKPQQSFKAFADYCQANPNNPFLPQFSGWETFEFKGRTYLQIRMERLFDFPGVQKWARELEEIADMATMDDDPDEKESYIDLAMNVPNDAGRELLTHLGEEGFNQLWKTIQELQVIANKNGFYLDLHEGNFMLGSDGHIVISDPFFTGWANR